MNLSDLERSLILPFYVLSVMFGCLVAFLVLGMAGGGHGWVSAGLSMSAIFLVPLGYTAWILRKRRVGLILATLILFFAIVFDVLIFSDTTRLDRVRANSYVFETWLFCWTIWRLPVAWVLVSRLFRRRQPL